MIDNRDEEFGGWRLGNFDTHFICDIALGARQIIYYLLTIKNLVHVDDQYFQ